MISLKSLLNEHTWAQRRVLEEGATQVLSRLAHRRENNPTYRGFLTSGLRYQTNRKESSWSLGPYYKRTLPKWELSCSWSKYFVFTLPMLRLLSSNYDTMIFDNQLNLVMLLFIRKRSLSTLRWEPNFVFNSFASFSIGKISHQQHKGYVHDDILQYRHLIPVPVDRTSAGAWLYKHPRIANCEVILASLPRNLPCNGSCGRVLCPGCSYI